MLYYGQQKELQHLDTLSFNQQINLIIFKQHECGFYITIYNYAYVASQEYENILTNFTTLQFDQKQETFLSKENREHKQK